MAVSQKGPPKTTVGLLLATQQNEVVDPPAVERLRHSFPTFSVKLVKADMVKASGERALHIYRDEIIDRGGLVWSSGLATTTSSK